MARKKRTKKKKDELRYHGRDGVVNLVIGLRCLWLREEGNQEARSSRGYAPAAVYNPNPIYMTKSRLCP